MSMTDPVADMLTRIRNACGSKHRRVDMPASKLKLEIVLDADQVDRVVDVLVESARSGKIGDGKVWVTEVESIIRIRTGETGPTAI